MTHPVSAVDVLGGRRVLGRVDTDGGAILDLVRKGFPYGALEALMNVLNLRRTETAELLNIRMRTLARRKRESRLLATESDRLYRIARVAAHAIEVFENEEAARSWLHTPSRVLGGATPLSLLDTDAGACRVDDELGRIEHGLGA